MVFVSVGFMIIMDRVRVKRKSSMIIDFRAYTAHVLGTAGSLILCVVTYGPRNLLSCAILTAVNVLCQALHVQLSWPWPWRW